MLFAVRFARFAEGSQKLTTFYTNLFSSSDLIEVGGRYVLLGMPSHDFFVGFYFDFFAGNIVFRSALIVGRFLLEVSGCVFVNSGASNPPNFY